MPRYALRIAYDGSDFCGWWRQPQQRSVAALFDQAFARIGEPKSEVLACSRTDAGVHARAQHAHVDCERDWQASELCRVLNGQLDVDVSCQAVARCKETWHACHAARAKTYSYSLDVGHVADPLVQRFTWRAPGKPQLLDLGQLNALAELIPGERDWSGFARSSDHREDYVREMLSCTWEQEGDVLRCWISGKGFTYHLVRSLVAAMQAVVSQQCTHEDFTLALTGTASPATHFQAPAKGLCLESISYDEVFDWQS